MRLSAVLEFEKKIFLLQNMRKMTHPFFHDASILVSVGVFLTHRFETVGVFDHFLCVKNAKTPSIWSSVFVTKVLEGIIFQKERISLIALIIEVRVE